MITLAFSSLSFAQDGQKVPPHPTRSGSGPGQAVNAVPAQQFAQRSQFALNVLHAAVALPQNDQQDRLRVLVSAARLANAVSAKTKKALITEGTEIEARLIASGEQPQVSMVEAGLVDCSTVAGLVEAVRPESIMSADKTITAAVQHCPRQALPSAERLLSDALGHNGAPPRALLAAMETAGPKSNWTLQQFDAVFSNLPDPSAETSVSGSPVYAQLYEEFAPAVDAASARSAGAKMLVWLGKMGDSPERVQAATTTVAAMKKVLGSEHYQEIVEGDPIAAQAANLAGQPTEIALPAEEADVAVGSLDTNSDHSNELSDEPAPRRAREGAAYGFAAGSAGNKQLAERYFETAFLALNEIEADRLPGLDVNTLVEEVSQAAANVDPISALQNAERLQDSAQRAISMLAVAQTVLTRQVQVAQK